MLPALVILESDLRSAVFTPIRHHHLDKHRWQHSFLREYCSTYTGTDSYDYPIFLDEMEDGENVSIPSDSCFIQADMVTVRLSTTATKTVPICLSRQRSERNHGIRKQRPEWIYAAPSAVWC